MKDRITVGTKLLLDFMFYSGIVVTATVPLSVYLYGYVDEHYVQYYIPLVLLFAVSGVFAVLVIYELRKMMRTVIADDCFQKENVKSLSRMGNYSFCIVVLAVLRLFLYLTSAILGIILVFIIAGLFSKVLAQVFDKAVNYKLENDLTI